MTTTTTTTRTLLLLTSRMRRPPSVGVRKQSSMRLGVVHQRCERHRDNNNHHHYCRRRRHRVRCESKSFFGHDAEALTVFAALVASRVVASNDTADGKASVFASAVVAPTWIVRWCRGDRGTRHYWIFIRVFLLCVTTFLVLLSN